MLKLRIKKNDIIKKFNVTEDKEQTNIPYLRFKRDYGEYYSNLKLLEGHLISEASNGCFVIDGKVWVIKDESVIDDNKAEHIIGIVLLEEGNGGTWTRVNQNLETIDFDSNNGIYKNIKTIETEKYGKMIEIPPVYVKTETFTEGKYEGKTCWWISDYPADGFHIHPAFIDEYGKVGLLRISQNWTYKEDYNYDDSNNPENELNSWKSDGIRAYSIYDHHILCRLMLIEFGTSDLYNLIKVDDGDDEENDYNKTTNYRGIENVMGDPDEWSQYKLAGIYADGYDGNVQIWKNDGSLKFFDTGLKVTGTEVYPLSTYTNKFDDVDMGDIFIGKDSVDDSLDWDEKPNASTFKAYQAFHGDVYIGTMYPGMFSLDGASDMSEVTRFVQVEPNSDSINIKQKPDTINMTEYYAVPLEQSAIPKTVTVTLEDDSTRNLEVAWDGSNYDCMASGVVQTVNGDIILNNKVTNDKGFNVTADITVEDMPEQTTKNIKNYSWEHIDRSEDIEKMPRENIKDLTNIKVEPDASHALYGLHNLTEFPKTYFVTWDTSEVTNMSEMLSGCRSVSEINISSLNVSNVKDMSYIFDTCTNITSLDISSWNTQNVENFYEMFNKCNKLETIIGIEDLNTSKANTLCAMFSETALRSLDLHKWNTSNVEDLLDTFGNMMNLKNINISGWDTSKVKIFDSMFINCNELETITGIEDISIESVDNDASDITDGITNMFLGCKKIKSLNLSKFANDINRLKIIESVFRNCEELETITGIENWDTSKAERLNNIFSGCKKLVADLSNWDISNAYSISGLLSGTDLTKITGWQNFDTSNVEVMGSIFSDTNLSTIDISNWNVDKVYSISRMFSGCSNLQTLILPDNFFSNGKVIEYGYMFNSCTSLPATFPFVIDCSGITDDRAYIISTGGGSYYNCMENMFKDSSVTEVTLKNVDKIIKPYITPENLKGNTGSITINFIDDMNKMMFIYPDTYTTMTSVDMEEIKNAHSSYFNNLDNCINMFKDCSKLTTINNMDKINFSKVKNMNRMFRNCTSLTSIPELDTSSVTSAQEMFRDCTSLSTVPEFDTSNMNNLRHMFRNCKSLPAEFPWVIDLGGISKPDDVNLMFEDSSVTKVRFKNVKEEFKSEITRNRLKSLDYSPLTIVFVS